MPSEPPELSEPSGSSKWPPLDPESLETSEDEGNVTVRGQRASHDRVIPDPNDYIQPIDDSGKSNVTRTPGQQHMDVAFFNAKEAAHEALTRALQAIDWFRVTGPVNDHAITNIPDQIQNLIDSIDTRWQRRKERG